MNMLNLTNKGIRARFFAAIVVSLLLSALPAAFFVANAANTDAVGDVTVNVLAAPSTPNGEFFTVSFTGTGTLNLDGWTVKDESSVRHSFASISLSSGDIYKVCQDIIVATGCDDVMDSGGANVWNNDGDTLTLRDETAEIVLQVTIPDPAVSEVEYTNTTAVDYFIPSAPTLEVVTPAPGAKVLAVGESFQWEVDAKDVDGDLYSLEIDHSLGAHSGTPEAEQLPEVTVYASSTNVYGSPAAAGEFAAAGVSVTYDDTQEKWTIDFGDTITDRFITEGGITFYIVLEDALGNTFGSMSPTGSDNTFVYTLSLPAPTPSAPTLEVVTPTEGLVEIPTGESFVWVIHADDVDGDLSSVEIDHSLSSPAFPEFSVYASATNPYGSPADEADFTAAGVEVVYNEAEQEWTLDFGVGLTDSLIAADGITFYIVLKDAAGNSFGSMYSSGEENKDSSGDFLGSKNTFVYDLSRPLPSAPTLEVVTPAPGAKVLAVGESFQWEVDAKDVDGDLYSLEIDHSLGENSGTPVAEQLPEVTVYASSTNVYGSPAAAGEFAAAGVSVTYDDTQEKWTIDFGDTITDRFITEGGITFYIVLEDALGNTFGSMSPTGSDNTFVYGLSRADIVTPPTPPGNGNGRGNGGGGSGTRVSRVEVCHNDNTIEVSQRAVRAHLGHGDTEGACEAEPQVRGAATSVGENNPLTYSVLSSLSTLLTSIQTANDNGDISDEEADVFRGQLGQIISALMEMFR